MKIKNIFVIVLVLLFNNPVFSAAVSKEGIHKRVDELIKQKKFDEAEKLVLEVYKAYPNEAEVIYLKLNEKMTDKQQMGDINASIRMLHSLETK